MQEKALVVHLELHKKVVKNAWILSYPEVMRMVRGTYVRILDAEMQELIDNGIEMEG